jgi:hypothetical protein
MDTNWTRSHLIATFHFKNGSRDMHARKNHLAGCPRNAIFRSFASYMCNAGKEGAVHMARALQHNSTLKQLHLHGNVLKEDGPKHLAKALHTNKYVSSLTYHFVSVCVWMDARK